MTFAALFSYTGALFCLATAAVFVMLYCRIGRRKADLVFSGLALCLGVMLGCELMHAQATTTGDMLFWTRIQYMGAFMGAAVFVHFVSVLTEEPLRRSVLVLDYLAGVALSAIAFTDAFIRLPPALDPAVSFASQTRGPLWPLLFAALLLVLIAWVRMLHGVWRRREGMRDRVTGNVVFLLVGGDLSAVLQCLWEGLDSPEHAAFVEQLRQRTAEHPAG